jgi:hypothetical protein
VVIRHVAGRLYGVGVDRLSPHPLLVLVGRAGLAHHPLHGEPLYAHALRALTDAVGPAMVVTDRGEVARVTREVARWRRDTRVFAGDEWWDAVRDDRDRGIVAHDVLCPLVGADFIGSVVDRARLRPGVSFVGVQAVTDTLKTVVDGTIRGTIDRERVATVTSPVVMAPAVLEALDGPPPVADFADVVTWLRERGEVELVKAPSLGRRLEGERGIHLLESLDEVGHRVRTTRGPGSS